MSTSSANSDRAVIDHLRRYRTATIANLGEHLGVTATAVRQRLARLVQEGLIQSHSEPAGRGRPTLQYTLTALGERSGGNNYDQLAQALWEELRTIDDAEIRRGLLGRVASRLAGLYGDRVSGDSLRHRMESLAQALTDREIPFEVSPCEENSQQDLPILTAMSCPFPDLAAQDRSICAMEKMFFGEVLDQRLRLSNCRLDGDNCCTFEVTTT